MNDNAAGLTLTSDKSHNGNLLFYNCIFITKNKVFLFFKRSLLEGTAISTWSGVSFESPHNFSGPKSKARVLNSKTVHFVFLNDGFTISSAKLLNLRS